MKAPDTRQLLTGWPTRRFELLQTPIQALRLEVAGSFHERAFERVRRDLERRALPWMPEMYLSNGWHCPDKVPVIGVPFTLATAELRRLEREVTGEAEGLPQMVRLLRHEVGHAYNYALKLHETREWRALFGAFSRPYREKYSPKKGSRKFVVHLSNCYAQKHPDEDFAETFAVWLQPRTAWRRDYEGWPALEKLKYVDRVMREARGFEHGPARGSLADPIDELTMTVAKYYQAMGYRVDDRGFQVDLVTWLDDDLRRVFRGRRAGGACGADSALRRLRRRIVGQVVELLGVRPSSAGQLYDKYVDRAAELGIETGAEVEDRLLVNVTTMMTRHLLNRKHTGRFTEKPRLVGCGE